MTDTPTDADLMEGIAAEDVTALRHLVERFSASVLSLCRRILRDPGQADDVAAEVFAELWHRRERFDPTRSAPKTYILLIARSRCLDRLRSQKQRPAPAAYDDQALQEMLPDRGRSPCEQVAVAELTTLVRSHLESLPEKQRRPLEMAYFDGLTHREIAERLESPLGSVKSHIRKGLLNLRRTLQPGLRGQTHE